jgi:predicted dehydrogenase
LAVRLASIGLGWWGGMLAEAVKRSGEAEIAACFARSAEARQSFAAKHGCRPADSLDAVLKDPSIQGVVLATPHSTHADLIVAAASAGKHVFVEKPLTLTVAEAKRAIAACERAGVTLLVGHNRRRQAATRRVRALIDEGALGVLHQLETNLSLPGNLVPRPGWRSEPAESPLGSMTPMGVHMVDNLVYLAGRVKRVVAFSKRILAKTALDDVTSVLLEFESGPLGFMNTTFVVPKVTYTAAYGTEGNAWSEEEGTKLYLQKKGEELRQALPVAKNDSLTEQMAEFARCVRGAAKPETGGDSSLEVVAVVEAAVESARSGRAVELAALR